MEAEAPANLLFTVSAPRAVLTAGMLELESVASEVLFHTARGDTGVFTTGPAHTLSPPYAYSTSFFFDISRPLYGTTQALQPCFGEIMALQCHSSENQRKCTTPL